jgi:hypothetical protein
MDRLDMDYMEWGFSLVVRDASDHGSILSRDVLYTSGMNTPSGVSIFAHEYMGYKL